MYYMNHILDKYMENLPSDVDRKKFADLLVAEHVLDDLAGFKKVLHDDFIQYALAEPSPSELHYRRIAFVAVLSFIESFEAASKQLMLGTHPIQRLTVVR